MSKNVFEERFKYSGTGLWPEKLKGASISICDTLDNSKLILSQVLQSDSFTASDIIAVAQMIFVENKRLNKLNKKSSED